MVLHNRSLLSGISKSDNATTYVVWMAHKEVVPDDDNDETSSRRHRRFHYENVKTTTSKQFVFSELRPAVKYAFRVSVQLPDRRHFGSKSSVIYYTSPKDLPPPTAGGLAFIREVVNMNLRFVCTME